MDGPLKNLLVLDLTRVLVGPYCTMMLSDLGARVIKVEAPEVGDDSRNFGPFIEDYSAYFMSLNRGKESIALNLKNSDDKKIFDKILAKADILVENFKPGTLEKWGYGWKDVCEKYPKLIYASASGFGQTGPLKELPAYDMVVQGMGGLMSVTGQPNSEPTRVGTSIGDITAGLFTTIGINAALYDREKTGKGTFIDVSMLDCQIAILENAIARYLSKNEIPKPMGSRHPSIAPFEAFKTKDSHIIIAAGNDKLFEKLCNVLEISEIFNDEKFNTNSSRSKNIGELKVIIENKLSSKGWGPYVIAQSFMVYSVMSVITLFFSGFLIDKFSSRKLLIYMNIPLIFSAFVLFYFNSPISSFIFFGFIGISNGFANVLGSSTWAEIYGVKYIGSVKALTTSLMVFSTAFGTALFGILIDNGFSIEQIALISATYISIAIISLYSIRNKLNPEYL
ncbi:MFS transporter [Candidatus Pelagibacter bacterium]|nr:MFS transporter [Candidatus Pelagibacter bacterium]